MHFMVGSNSEIRPLGGQIAAADDGRGALRSVDMREPQKLATDSAPVMDLSIRSQLEGSGDGPQKKPMTRCDPQKDAAAFLSLLRAKTVMDGLLIARM